MQKQYKNWIKIKFATMIGLISELIDAMNFSENFQKLKPEDQSMEKKVRIWVQQTAPQVKM